MMITSISCNPVIGRDAFEKWLKIAFTPGETIWLKQGSIKFYQGRVGNNYIVSGWETQGDRDNRWKVRFFDDLFVELERGAIAGVEEGLGVYFIAGKPTDAPTKECCLGSSIIGFELDDGTDAEQWGIIERVAHLAGVTPNYLLTSGGKSNHGGYVLTEFVTPERNKFYRQLVSIAHLSDPAVITQSQPMRTAGFYRAGKGKHQELRYTNEVKLSPQEFEAAMQRCFAGLGFAWWSASQFSEERWRQVRRVLVNKQLSRQEKESQIRDVLALPETVINPPRPEPRPVADFQYSGDRIPLEFFLARENKKLLEAGQSEGDRDNAGFRVAKDLIGAADALLRLGINHDGDARQLFEDFASRCSPPLASRDIERIWRSASRGTPKAALPDDAIQSRVSFWQWQQNPQKGQEWDESAEFYSQRAEELERWENEQEAYFADKKHQDKVQWLGAYPERVKWTQERLKSLAAFNPIIQNTQFVELLVKDFLPKQEPQQPLVYSQEPQAANQNSDQSLASLPEGVYAIAAGMGSGKTHLMIEQIIKRFGEGNLISFRNSLLTQVCYDERIKAIIHFLWDLEKNELNPKEKQQRWAKAKQGWMAACVESIAKCRPKDVLVLEEVEKIKKSLLESATCRRDRRGRLREFVRHLQRAKYIFCLDADLTGTTLNWLRALVPDKKINVIQNVKQRFQWDCYFFTGAREFLQDGTVRELPNKKADFELELLSRFARGEKLLIASDSQRWAESIERALLTVNPGAKGLRVDSITKADDATKDEVDSFLQNPNKWTPENQPDYTIYTPTCEASLDITIENYFDAVFGCFVHLNHYSCKQMLGRLRTNAPRFIFAKTHAINDDGGSKSPLPQVVMKHMFQHNFETIREILLAEYPEIKDDFQLLQKMNEVIDFESQQYKDPHIQALVESRAMDNYSRANLRQNLVEELRQCGHNIHLVDPGDAEVKSASAPFREEIMKEWALAIANATDIDITQAWEIQQSMTANLEDRHAATKAILKDRLPEFTLTSNFVYHYHLDDRQWINRQEMRYLLDHPEIAKTLDCDRWASALKFDTAWWDVRTNSLVIKALRTLGIPEIAKSGKTWDKNTDWVLEFKQRAIANSKLVKLALGITATEESDACYLLRRCLERAGYPVKGRQRRIGNGERVRYYQVDTAVLMEDHSIYAEAYKAIEKRFTQKANKNKVAQTNLIDISFSSVRDTPPDAADAPVVETLEDIQEILNPHAPEEETVDLPFKIGDRVRWLGDGFDGAWGCDGTVIDYLFNDVKVKWTRKDGTAFDRRQSFDEIAPIDDLMSA